MSNHLFYFMNQSFELTKMYLNEKNRQQNITSLLYGRFKEDKQKPYKHIYGTFT